MLEGISGMNPVNEEMMTTSGVGLMTPPPPVEGTQQYCLRWNSYPATIATQLASLRVAEDFVDVTLACDGQQVRAHKLVLSACSPYFMQLFKSTPCQHPVVFLKDVRFCQLRALLEFMYAGEVNVSQTELPALLRTAEALQVRGLADTTNNNNFATQLPQKPIFTQQQQYVPVPNPAVAPSPQPIIPPIPTQLLSSSQQATQNPSLHMSLEGSGCDSQMMTSDVHTLPISGLPPELLKRGSRDDSLGNESSKENQMDMSSSDSNDSQSQEDYTTVCPYDEKPIINQEQTMAPLTGNPFVNMSNAGDAEMERECLIGQESSVDELGSISLGGSQSEGESSEDENDEDDAELKESFPFASEAPSFPNQEMGTNKLNPPPNGENLAGPSMMSSFPFAPTNSDKSKDLNIPSNPGTVPPPPRSRFSRSYWPPGIPYHGPQQCPYCPRVLSNVGNWRKHVMTMHIAHEKNHKCRHCNSSFRTPEYLQKHYVRVHSYQPKMSRKKGLGTGTNTVTTTPGTSNSNPSTT